MKKIVSDELVAVLQEYATYVVSQGGDIGYVDNLGIPISQTMDIAFEVFKRQRVMFGDVFAYRLSKAEQIIGKSLRDDMAKKVFYKDIYQNVKTKVTLFAELHGKSEIINKQLGD